jgi:hypothetical protein
MFVLSKFAIAIISPLGSALLGGLLAMVAGYQLCHPRLP